MSRYLKSVHIIAPILGSFFMLATLASLLTLVEFMLAPEKLDNRPGNTLTGVIASLIVFALAAVSGLAVFFMRKSKRGRVAGMIFGGLLCLNILWVPLTLLPGYKVLTVVPVILAIIGIWTLLVLTHPETPAAIEALGGGGKASTKSNATVVDLEADLEADQGAGDASTASASEPVPATALANDGTDPNQ